MNTKNYKKTALLIGIAGSNNAFSLSLYNLKAYALNDPQIKELWEFPVSNQLQTLLATKTALLLLRAR